MIDDLKKLMLANNLTMLTSEVFKVDPTPQIHNIKVGATGLSPYLKVMTHLYVY